MAELGTALRELADRQQPVDRRDPGELWRRGRRRVVRRRVLGGAVLATLVLVVAGLGVAGPEPRLLSPAGQPHRPGIPNQVEDPPGWLPVAEYGTRMGPLSVLGRGLRHGRMELFGIDASSGKYRFLPNGEAQVPDTPVALSPSGRYVAYWAGEDGKTVTSLSVLDTVTGTESGLGAGDETKDGVTAGPLTWLDDKTLLLSFEATHAPDTQPAPAVRVETFGVDGAGPDEVDISPEPSDHWSRGRDGSLLERVGPPIPSTGSSYVPTWESLGSDLRENGRALFLVPNLDYYQVSRSGDLVVVVGSTTVGGHRSLLGGEGRTRVPALRDLGDLYVGTFLGWRSADTVLVTGFQHAPDGQASLFEANVRTGAVKRVGDAGDDVDVVLAVASDLLDAPVVAARPPHGINPAIVRLGGVAALFLVVTGLLLWRRRGRL